MTELTESGMRSLKRMLKYYLANNIFTIEDQMIIEEICQCKIQDL